MKIYSFFLLIFFVQAHSSFSQDSIKSIRFLGKNWKKGTINFSVSTVKDKYYRNKYSFDDFVSNSKDPSRYFNFNKYEFQEYNNYIGGSGIYNLSFSFYPYSKKLNKYKSNNEIRFGLVYYTRIDDAISFASKYFRSQHFYGYGPDTSYISNVNYKQTTDEIGIETAYLFRSPGFLKRFSLFGGIATGVSLSVFSEVHEQVNTFSSREICDTTSGNNYCYSVTNNEFTNNYHKNNPAFSIKALLPYGLDIRLVNTLHFYIEGRSGLSYHKFMNGKGKLRTHQGIGIGVRFNY